MKMNKGMIKKFGMIALSALFAASLAACKPQNQGGSTTPTPEPLAPISGDVINTLDPNATQAPVLDPSGFSYQFVRIPYSENANTMTPIVVSDTEQLRTLIVEKLSAGMTSKTDAEDYFKQYNDEFFKTNYILAFNLTFSSGSVIPQVKGVTLENGVVTVTAEGTMEGDVGTADMASHMCLLTLDAAKFPANSSFSIIGAGTAKTADTEKR